MHLVASVRLGNVPGSRRHPQIRKSFPCGSAGKEPACSAGDLGSIPRLGRSPEEGNGNPLQYSCLENPMEEPGRLLSMGHKESDTTEQPTLSLSLQLEKLEKLWAWFQGWRVRPRSVCTHGPQGGAATPSTLGPGQGCLGLMRGAAGPRPPCSDERGRDPDLTVPAEPSGCPPSAKRSWNPEVVHRSWSVTGPAGRRMDGSGGPVGRPSGGWLKPDR